jgi:hypothetical protein
MGLPWGYRARSSQFMLHRTLLHFRAYIVYEAVLVETAKRKWARVMAILGADAGANHE